MRLTKPALSKFIINLLLLRRLIEKVLSVKEMLAKIRAVFSVN